jgi:hypothetical protein
MENQEVNNFGSNNNINVAGGDIIERQENFFQYFYKTEFFEPNLDRYAPPEFPLTRCENRIIDAVLRQNLIVIGASPGIDKPALCRHFSWRLREELSGRPAGANEGNTLSVQEWSRGAGAPNLTLSLRQTKQETIFILPQIKPQDVGYGLKQLAKAAQDCGHYVIASTDASRRTWRLTDPTPEFWQELTPQEVYEQDDLAHILLQQLNGARQKLKGILKQEQLGLDLPLADHSTVRTLSRRLETPENISIFVELLSAEKERVEAATIEKLVRLIQSDDSRLELWFRSLQKRDQMLALGLSLFEQFFDDQFFAAFDYLVQNVWHRRDESLLAVDYCDLDELQGFFNLVQGGGHDQDESYVINIQGRLPNQRRRLFRVAWNSHRRQILTALPAMVQLAKASVYDISANQELYGSYERRDRLRKAVSDTLSDVGLISSQLVEESLLKLATDNDWAIQAIAARAVARWREYEEDGKNDLMIKTLENWEKDTRLLNLVRSIVEGSKSEKKVDPINYIRATLALAVGYAAYYDPPNDLSGELYNLLNKLAEDSNRFVRDRFCRFTLPVVVRLHLWQLDALLWNMITQPDLIDRVAWSLAQAHRANPGEVERFLANWDSRNQQDQPNRIRYTETSDYEKRQAAIVLTYGWIKYDKDNIDKGFAWIESALKNQESPYIRRAVALAMSRQAERDFKRVAPKLQQLMKHVAAQERGDIVEILRHVYFRQRSKLDGGDGVVEINNQYFDTWTNGRQKITVIERELINWLKDPDHPAAQQIAALSSVVFAKSFDQEEKKQVAQLLEERLQATERRETLEFQRASQTSIQPKEYLLDFYTKVAIWVASRNRSEDIPFILKGLFPEIMDQRSSNRSALDFVMEKWRKSQDRKLAEITRAVDQAIWLRANMRIILLFSSMGVMAILLIVFFIGAS